MNQWPTARFAENIYVHILAGQSNAHGLRSPFTASSVDKQIMFWPEVGTADDSQKDYTRDEFPPGTPADAPRWEQDIPRAPYELGPTGDRTGDRWGIEIFLARFARTYLAAHGRPGRAAIAKFAFSSSILNKHWIRNDTVSLADRMVTFLRDVGVAIERGGGRAQWSSLTWIQGEGDCLVDADASAYRANARKLFSRIRQNTVDPLPLIVVRTSMNIDEAPAKLRSTLAANQEIVRAAQEQICRDFPVAGMVDVDDIAHLDFAHFAPGEYGTIARRVFDTWQTIQGRTA